MSCQRRSERREGEGISGGESKNWREEHCRGETKREDEERGKRGKRVPSFVISFVPKVF